MDKGASLRISWQLSWAIVAGATAASAGGLLIPGLYRDNAFVRTAWLGVSAVCGVVLLRNFKT